MNIIILILFLFALPTLADVTPVTLLLDGENSADGTTITPTIMNNIMENNGDLPSGSWSVSGSQMEIDTSGERATIGTFSVGGTNYADTSGTRGMSLQSVDGNNQYVEYDFDSAFNGDFSVGFWWYYPDCVSQDDFWDVMHAETFNGGWAVPQTKNGCPGVMVMHTGNANWGTEPDGAQIALTESTWYWVTFVARRNGGACVVNLYDTAGSLVGTSSHIPTPNISSGWSYINFGRTDGHPSINFTGASHFDDIVMDFSQPPLFPLGPGTASSTDPYWVSTTGTQTWAGAQSATALAGAACASVTTMESNIAAGHQVYLRAGTYNSQIHINTKVGTASQPIIIEAYSNEVFTITTPSITAMYVHDSSYVTFRKIKTDGSETSLLLEQCTWTRWEDCTWTNHSNNGGPGSWPIACYITSDSQYNVFTNCVIGECGEESGGGDDLGGVLEIGLQNVETDDSRYNLFTDCTLFRGGHHVASIHTSFNYFERCHFYNDEWYGSPLVGNRNYISETTTTIGANPLVHGNNTIRNCTFFRAGDPPDDNGVSSVSLRTWHNRVHHCAFVDGSNAGQNFDGGNSISNRVANCVFVNNGVTNGIENNFESGGVSMSDGGGSDPLDCRVRNCVFDDNYNGNDFVYNGVTAGSRNPVTNNWLESEASPAFTDWDVADLDPSNASAHDFHLASSSSGPVNNGGYLTTISTAGGTGTSFVVEDSYWFADGDGITTGDVIQVQNSAIELTISDIDYSTHTITFTPSVSWVQGNGVAFPYQSPTPDQGMFEFAGAVLPGMASTPSPANGATGVDVDTNPSWAEASGASGYDVYFSTNATPTFALSTPSTSYEPGTLAFNQLYYWQIDSTNVTGTTTNDTVWSFTTAPDTVATPSITPTAVVHWPTNLVTITDNEGSATVYYETDGTTPTTNSTLYSVPFALTTGQYDVRAFAVKAGQTDSAVDTQLYQVDNFDSSNDVWQSVQVTSKTNDFRWTFKVTPMIDTSQDGIVAMAETAPTDFTDCSMLIRWWSDGNVNVRSNADYTADITFPYATGVTYDVIVDADMTNFTYDVQIREAGGTYSNLATGYAFRDDQPTPATLGFVGWIDVSTGGGTKFILKNTLVDQPGLATVPGPADGVTNVAVGTDLTWTGAPGADGYEVYWSTNASPSVVTNAAATTYDTGTMSSNTLYYWKLVSSNTVGLTTGAVWSFTTAVPSAGPATPWALTFTNGSRMRWDD